MLRIDSIKLPPEAGMAERHLTASTISFVLAPRINAAGRPMMFGTAATNVVALTPELEPELIAAKLMLLECGMVQCTAAQKGAVQLVAKDVGVISDDSGKPTEDTDTHKVRADRYVM